MRFYKNLPGVIMVPFNVVISCLIRTTLSLVSLLPVRLLLPITRSVGTCVWMLARRRRHIVRRNLDIAFGDTKSPKEKSRLSRKSFQHAASSVASFTLQNRWLNKAYRDRFTVSPEDDALLEAGSKSGTAVLSAHVGNWEMGQLYMFLRDFPLVAFARDIGNPFLNAAIRRSRAQRGGAISNSASGAMRQALRRGENFGILADQNDRRRMHFADFFGVPASSYIGYARILLRSRCRILFSACLEESRSPLRYHFTIRELRPAGDPTQRWTKDELDTASRKLVRDYLDAAEEVIRSHPEQYFWMHRRWKSRPLGSPRLYENLGQPLDRSIIEESKAWSGAANVETPADAPPVSALEMSCLGPAQK